MSEIIEFASYLTGNNEETTIQMYNDWLRGRQIKAEMEHINDITDPINPEPQMNYE